MSKEEQFLLANNIEKHFNLKIIKNENEPYTLYCMKDLGKILDTNIFSHNCKIKTEKVLIKSKTNGGEQLMSYITYKGLIKYLSKIRLTSAIDFCNKIGLDISRNIFSSIETDTLKCIMDVFQNENYEEQYVVDKYRIDLFFPQYMLAIECDEDHHNSIINTENDIKRENEIKEQLDGCVFIRYKPFLTDFNIFTVINKIYNHIMEYIETERKKEREKYEIQMIKMKITLVETETKLIVEEIKKFQEETILLEKKIELKHQSIDTRETTEINDNNQSTETENVENNEEEINCNFVKRRFNTRSPKVFQYNKDTLELINIYDSVIDVIRNVHGSSHTGLREASKANTIYKNCRWVLQDRDIIETPIPLPTVKSSNKSIEYIAMIDIKKTKIMEVFASQRDAAESRNLAGFSTISRAIKQSSISSGHYWNFFDKCSQEMQDEFLSNNSLPDRFIKKNSKYVIQIDPITNKEIQQFASITDVTLKFQMSHTTLKKVSISNEIHKGYKWKIITSE
jgi:very-short-patch-repair endonuclease